MNSYYVDINKFGEQTNEQFSEISELSGDERARMLWAFGAHLQAKGWPDLKLLPAVGKQPIYVKRGWELDSDETRDALHTPEEAAEALRAGEWDGFFLVAGRADHGTENLLILDRDEPEKWSDTSPTLRIISGSGEADHLYYKNDGTVRNSKATGDLDGAGSVRTSNWGVAVPGSAHSSGGVYHVANRRTIATLTADDLPEELRPVTGGGDGGEIPETDEPPEPDANDVATAEALLRDFQADDRTTGRAFHELIDLVNGNYAEHGHITDGDACRYRAGFNAITLLYGVFRRYGDDDDDPERLATAYLTHGCSEHPYTADGQPRKWHNLDERYRRKTASRAVESFDPDVFELWTKKREDGAREWTGEYNEDSEHRVLQTIAVLSDPDEPEHYPTRADIVAEASDWDDGHLSDESYRRILTKLVNDRGQVKTAKVGHNDWRYYLSFEPDPPGAEVVRYRGDEHEPGESGDG